VETSESAKKVDFPAKGDFPPTITSFSEDDPVTGPGMWTITIEG
jgi:hypothetical protein